MHLDLLDDAGGGLALVSPAEVERGLHANAAHGLDVVLGQMAEMVGAKDLPPADRAAVAGRVAAEVAEVAGALKIEVA